MAKKNCRANNTYLVEGGNGDNPKLCAQILTDGRESLYLEFYLGFEEAVSKNGNTYNKAIRETERLGLFLWCAPRTPEERQHNKATLELAKKIRFEKGQELLEQKDGYRLRKTKKVDFLEFFQAYIGQYKMKDYRMIGIAFNRFKDFLRDTPEYSKFQNAIKPEQLTKGMMEDFTDYLKSRSVGEGAKSIYQRFKKVVNYAIEHDVMVKNPCVGVSIKVDEKVLRKDVLSEEEIKRLMATHYDNENTEIRRAFIFCLYSGLRFCDVKVLRFANVDYSNKVLKFEQQKTKGWVVMGLTDDLIDLIGKPRGGNKNDLIFDLPSYETCLHALKRWVARAGIDKNISWHCARHSFATNILMNGANVKVVQELLGHSSLKYTEKYMRATEKAKLDALSSLPKIEM